ncbi:MAG: NADP-dependent glyceraldehyde-3-phosphate dehydrogenase [Candidatus Lokiarchaeota archaeon]|nr:NADP-dependent glyceraldehyde-3-phosphate dehydrogenase [Candidatus Lokiarchaeota archaeon]
MRDGLEFKYFGSGTWKKSSSGKTLSVKNPYNGEIVGTVQACSTEEANQVILTANDSVECWNEKTQRERADVLMKAAKLMRDWANPLGYIMMKEIGKPLKSAISEILRTAEFFEATAEAGLQQEGEAIYGDTFKGFSRDKMSITYRVPLGVILCIGPFNYPFNLTGSKIAPALMAGNTVVVKPPSQGAISPLFFGLILEKAGVPPGVFNIITGKGSEIGDYLVQHPLINMISFTGSSETGKHLASVAGMKPLLLELGGKDAAIVLNDADLELTTKAIVSGAFSYSGQRCTAVKRVLPMPGIADDLIKLVKEKTLNLSIGNPEENATIGPLISSIQCDFVQGLIDDALEKGATLLCGNKREGNIMWPTLLDNVTTEMRIAWEEPFGPVLPFIRTKNIQEAIEISNKSEYGLQGMIFTENIDLAFHIAQELEVGIVQINGRSERGPDHFPFLGTKSSGLGTQGIKYSIEAMSRPKGMVLNLSDKGKLIKLCK